MSTATLLLEIGCEELPAGPLPEMAHAFARQVQQGLLDSGLLVNTDNTPRVYFTPRRLAVQIEEVLSEAADKTELKLGPNVDIAFAADGSPKPAATGFANSVGASVEQLQRVDSDKGQRLAYSITVAGQTLRELLQSQLQDWLLQLPMPKTMRWSDGSKRFLRPVQWLLGLHGSQPLAFSAFGLNSDCISHGHRIHAPTPIAIACADNYVEQLQAAHVIVDEQQRQDSIVQQLKNSAETLDLSAEIDQALVTEVANLCEWPVAIDCSFDKSFLQVPAAVLVLSMKSHQKFFPLYTPAGELSHHFVAFANLQSQNPDLVRLGFERVIRPRLADAVFFWEKDQQQPLSAHAEKLAAVSFQQQLGSLADKTARTKQLAIRIAGSLSLDSQTVARAADLSLADLVTDMVGEFPELQGSMGRHYALASGEAASIAAAIEQHYWPLSADSPIAESIAAQVLALAERFDRLVGIFAIGKLPTGNKDPFGLRRAALGIIRTIIEAGLDLELDTVLPDAASILDPQISVSTATLDAVREFILERLIGYLSLNPQLFRAVAAVQNSNLLDFVARVEALKDFASSDSAAKLAEANKRARNILRKNAAEQHLSVDISLFENSEESQLFDAIRGISKTIDELIRQRNYPEALQTLSGLQAPVDAFFSKVMVMTDNPAVQHNRLALLQELQSLCSRIAALDELAM